VLLRLFQRVDPLHLFRVSHVVASVEPNGLIVSSCRPSTHVSPALPAIFPHSSVWFFLCLSGVVARKPSSLFLHRFPFYERKGCPRSMFSSHLMSQPRPLHQRSGRLFFFSAFFVDPSLFVPPIVDVFFFFGKPRPMWLRPFSSIHRPPGTRGLYLLPESVFFSCAVCVFFALCSDDHRPPFLTACAFATDSLFFFRRCKFFSASFMRFPEFSCSVRACPFGAVFSAP